ncbi:MAG: M48 family metallopeptidase [Rothia sp. (in: high G+C Gram-positive bacteria)]|nr:M48 family metallopeptidase [Rothia sp. (in: high G+C Gram-positive bacteria)]
MPQRKPTKTTEVIAATGEMPEIIVVRSPRRTKTVGARLQPDGRLKLMVPARSTVSDISEYIEKLAPQVLATHRQSGNRKRHFASDEYLQERARVLIKAYLPELEMPASIRWVTNQNTRWGSATPSQGRIRLSHVLQQAPEYVKDFVLFHELCHFVELNHSARFRALESLYPRKAEAEAFLEGLTLGQKLERQY